MKNIFFNAHHSPIGAFSSFTLGFKGAKGGLGLELGKPADQNIYIGLESNEGEYYEAFPFFEYSKDESKRFDIEKTDNNTERSLAVIPFKDSMIKREYSIGTDSWHAKDLSFTVFSPVCPIPDPELAEEALLKRVLLPAVFIEMTVDNTQGKKARRAFLGYEGNDPYTGMRKLKGTDGSKITGIGQGRSTAIVSSDPGVKPVLGFSIEYVLKNAMENNWTFGLGNCGALIIDTPPGQKSTYRFAVCFYKGGIVTSGINASYYYSRFFDCIEEVALYAMDNYNTITNACRESNNIIESSRLSENQRFMITHSIRSYYGSTELLDYCGKPFWIVNEGEYRMINTLDLTIDQIFYELKMNPWTIRNVLDMYLERFSYRDNVTFAHDSKEYPGGISFTHDMGVANIVSEPGYSSYEMSGLDGCFSYMTHEQLVNWSLCAAVYVEQTGDRQWLKKNLHILVECFESMLNRDNADPGKRDGIMSMESIRTMGGAEITTYDSLDTSLGQARNNIYLAGKCWALYVAFGKLFKEEGMLDLSRQSFLQAKKCADTIIAHVTDEGFIPAVLGEGNYSRIIPAVEGLVFPYFTNCREALRFDGEFGEYILALIRHLENILVPGTCLFEDGGWKLSSTSNNSWLSKIYLCQFIARHILRIKYDIQGKDADAAHVEWLTHTEHSYWCFSDQIISGIISGSKYYPRGVTSILWLEEESQ